MLKDKRLVSGGGGGVSGDGLIVVYDHSHQPQIQIQNAHDYWVHSLCGLRNGDLASASESDERIKIWRIGENDYQLIHTLKEHTHEVTKVIELEDGRLSSCSCDRTIRIWDNNTYQSITTITTGHTSWILSIIEMNDSIISVSRDKTLIVWNKSTYECIKTIQNVDCYHQNALEKLNNHTVLIGGRNKIYVVDIESSEVKQPKDKALGAVFCFRVIRNDLLLFGNEYGEIFEYNPISNKIISESEFHNKQIRCLIGTEDNKIISFSYDKTMIIYEYIDTYKIYYVKKKMNCFVFFDDL